MANAGSDVMGRVKQIWGGMSRPVRWLTVGLLVALALSLAVAVYLNRPRWEVFYKASDPSEVSTLVAHLDELGVPSRVTGNGLVIEVPARERSAANLAKAQAGLPSSGHVGLEIFAQPQFGATEFDRQVNYKRAMEGELSRSLMRIADIEYAKVNLNVPEKSVFVRDEEPPSAAVLVQLRSGRTLDADNVTAIINFVASSVEGLTPDRVTVIDSQGRELRPADDDAQRLDAEALAFQRQREEQLTQKLLQVLEPIFGRGNVAASVTVELDHQSSRTEERIVGQGVPVATVSERSGSQTQGTSTEPAPVSTQLPGQGETPGVTAPAVPIYQEPSVSTESGESYQSRTETRYDVGERNQVTVSPAGSVKRISAAVTINQDTLTQSEIDLIRQHAASATGAQLSDVTVLAMSFRPTAQADAAPPAPEAAAGSRLFDARALAIGLGIASFLLILAALLTRRRESEPEFALPGHPAVGTALDVALGLDQPLPVQQAAAAEAAPAAPEAPEAAPAEETDVQITGEMTAAEKFEEVMKRRRPPRQPIDPEDFMDDDILADIDVLLEQAPEACAEVIRHWLKGGI
ncbi:flagellar basal-body MS-ring/collar protein FliF [Symbiobacterium thermophilum]|uniref:Flagellar M-ring protein n=1 Tax=Symbiobacterium thermophilum (strain DSM 24528 / JCM 14929 / IAM 14863 / T) TaxID=292459 RepID=Q67K14_SYMTH|nr:flagellar basal-body MS-ring/collar protein FliF [Symbiobacterium thermophilum]BAD41986.1 flagellar basal-body M-ring protein [Symbiobacterium thermophilum IAM 14863]